MSTYQQQAPPQGEVETITGQVVSVITKGQDKWQIAVQPENSQYTKNLWTKDFALVQQMQQSIGQWFSFLCGVSHWTNNEGKPIRSLWVNALSTPGGNGQQQAAPTYPQQPAAPQQPVQQAQGAFPQQQAPQPRVSDSEREMRIHRQTAMKVAASMLPYMPPEERTFGGMVNVAEGLVRYFQVGPQAVPQQPPPQQQQAPEPVYENAPPAPGDDDIPWPTQ